METRTKDSWNSKIGVILAVAGSAVGLGNFLRFPGQVAEFGGGAFMLAYFLSLIILGLPIAWMEWILGRYAGRHGFSSAPGILNLIWRHPLAKYIGVLSIVTLLCLYTYYSYIEAWCLGYAVNFLTGNIDFSSVEESGNFFSHFIGFSENGTGFRMGISNLGPFIVAVFCINFFLIYRGISRGIEKFAKFAVPTLLCIAVIVLIRVLTLGAPDPALPENNINNGLGFMWNPTKVFLEEKQGDQWITKHEIIGEESIKEYRLEAVGKSELRLKEITILDQLKRPSLWLAAAGQVFFSLSIGFGAIMVYASYIKQDDDIVLSSLSAISANEFSEVCLGGLISVPAAYAFLGAAGVVGQGIFGLGFNVLPLVFSQMYLGNVFGFLFFFLLFLASISGVLCQMQSGIAFIEEAFDFKRKKAVMIIGLLTLMGSFLVIYYSKDLKAMATFDFWIGTFMIFVVTTINLLIFGWVFGTEKAFEEAHKGAALRIPGFFKWVIKYICPAYLLTIFFLWVALEALGLGGKGIEPRILDLIGSADHPISITAWIVVGNIILVGFVLSFLASRVKKYKDLHRPF